VKFLNARQVVAYKTLGTADGDEGLADFLTISRAHRMLAAVRCGGSIASRSVKCNFMFMNYDYRVAVNKFWTDDAALEIWTDLI
jgi:hypothetical protein